MEKMDKTHVAAISAAGVLLLLLAVVMICGGCSNRSNPEWDFSWKPQTTDGSTDAAGTTTGETTNTTTDNTTGTSGETTTAPSQGQSGGSGSQGNSGGADNSTKPSTPTTKPTTPSTTPPASTDATTSTEPTPPETEGKRLLTWEEWLALNKAKDYETMKAYRDSFPNQEAYFAWLENAEAEYNATMPTTDGKIDFSGSK